MGNSQVVTNIVFILLIAAMIVFMWISSRKQRKQQQAESEWRQHLKPGDKVSTVSGLLGEVVSADPDHDQVTIKSGDSVSVWMIRAIRRPPVIPKYADEEASGDSADSADEPDASQAADAPAAEIKAQSSDSDGASAADSGKSADASKDDAPEGHED